MDIYGFNGGLYNQQGYNPCCGTMGLGSYFNNPFSANVGGFHGTPTNWYFNSPIGNAGYYSGLNQAAADAVLQSMGRINPFLTSFQQQLHPITQGIANGLAGFAQYNPLLSNILDYNMQFADACNASIRQAFDRARQNLAGFGSGWASENMAGINPILHQASMAQAGLAQLQQLAHSMMSGSGVANFSSQWVPAVDIIERPDSILVRADIPGYSGKEVDVYLEHNVLVIRGQKESQHQENVGTFHSMERRAGGFYRRINLPYVVEASQVKARLNEGTLELAIPKQGRNQVELGEVKSTKVKVA